MQHKDQITPLITSKENAFILIAQFTLHTPTVFIQGLLVSFDLVPVRFVRHSVVTHTVLTH